MKTLLHPKVNSRVSKLKNTSFQFKSTDEPNQVRVCAEDGSGGLTVEEFVDGALKLKGPAKGIATQQNLQALLHRKIGGMVQKRSKPKQQWKISSFCNQFWCFDMF